MQRFQGCWDDLCESVYPTCGNYKAPSRYRSRFAKKVRVDMWVQKSGCYSTMGPPRAFLYERPEYFLKKHSGVPPVFFDRFTFRNHHAEMAELMASGMEERRKLVDGPCFPRVDPGERDFLRENALRVIRIPHRRLKRCYVNDEGCHTVDFSEAPLMLQPEFGQVPEYLRQRQWEMYCEDQALRREREASQFPPGYRLMDFCERSYLVEGLQTRWDQLTREFVTLPGQISEAVNIQKECLEAQLKEIEKDLRLLNTNSPILIARDSCCSMQDGSQGPSDW